MILVETENAVEKEIKNILVPDGHFSEKPKLLGNNLWKIMSSLNSISSSLNLVFTVFYDKSKCKVSEITSAKVTRKFVKIVKQTNKQQSMKST